MKIVIDLTSLADNFSGIERMALNITKELLAINVEYTYQLYFKREVYPEFLEYQKDSRVECIVLPQKSKLWFYQVTLFLVFVRSDADVFFFPAFPPPFFLRKKNIISTIQDMGCWDCPKTMKKHMMAYFRLMYWKFAWSSWKIVTISEFSKNRILKYLKAAENKVEVVYLGVSPEMFDCSSRDWERIREKYRLPKKYMMCLSTLEPRKNMAFLVDVYCSLSKSEKNGCSLVLSGRKGWKMEHFLKKIPEMKKKGVYITDYVENKDLPLLYQHAEFFVFTSLYEGFGIPPLEAMAVGCPVVCSDIDVAKEILGDKVIYFRSNDRESLKSVLVRCLNGKEKFPSKNRLIDYSRRFTYREAAEKMKVLFEKIK